MHPIARAKPSAAACSATPTKRSCNRSRSSACSRRPKFASIALAQMDIAPASIVWDIGAGSGSVSIEAAQMATEGARLRDRNGCRRPRPHPRKRRALRRGERERRPRPRPEVCDELPDPDAVFVAGAGREVTRISQAAYQRLRPRGRLVVNTTSIDHLMELRDTLRSTSADVRIWMINLARGTDQLDRLSFDALKPSFLLAVTKS